MKENGLKTTPGLEPRLREQLLMARRVEGDRLMLDDAIIKAALTGSRPLTANERDALARSPLTMRRFRRLAIERAGAAIASMGYDWQGSAGMLRAAATDAALAELVSDDNHWALHFLARDGGWQVILKLAADAPFAADLMRKQPLLRVVDGCGAIILQGQLDADGECESAWPFDSAPAPHFQQSGATFAVEPVRASRR
jgi:hypothetical protein